MTYYEINFSYLVVNSVLFFLYTFKGKNTGPKVLLSDFLDVQSSQFNTQNKSFLRMFNIYILKIWKKLPRTGHITANIQSDEIDFNCFVTTLKIMRLKTRKPFDNNT